MITIVKFEDNASNYDLILKWIKFMRANIAYPIYYMKFVDLIKGYLDSNTYLWKANRVYLYISNFNLDGLE